MSGDHPLIHPFRGKNVMKITVFLHTTLQKQIRNNSTSQLTVDLPVGGTLASLLDQLPFELDIENTLLVVNGHNTELSQRLSDGDQVHLIPAISGG
jgi:molybdopterin converting factor small subunit